MSPITGFTEGPAVEILLDPLYTEGPAVEVFVEPLSTPPPPITTINSGPLGTSTTDTTPTFGWSVNAQATSEVRVDSGPWASVGSATSYTTPTLSVGTHTFSVRSTDIYSQLETSPPTVTFAIASVAVEQFISYVGLIA